MLLQSQLDFDQNEAQNIVIHNIGTLSTTAKNGTLAYYTQAGQQGLYLRKEGVWIHLGQVEALANGGIQITPVSGIQYLSVRVDGTTIIIDANGDLGVKPNSIGNTQLDNANIRIGDFAAPNADFSMNGFKIIALGTPTNPTDAATKEYVDQQVAATVVAQGAFIGDWATSAYPTVGSGDAGAIQKGDWWRISTAVTIGDKVLEVGDALFAKTNAPGTTDSNWFVLQNNVGEATSTALGLVRVSEATDLTPDAGANPTRVVRVGDLLLRTASLTRQGLIEIATQGEVDAGTDTARAVTPNTLAVYVNARIGSRSFAANIGDGVATTIVITHNLGSRDVIAQVYRNTTPWDDIIVDKERTTANSITIKFGTAPAAASFRANFIRVA